jgi:PncC family amidohydrolase
MAHQAGREAEDHLLSDVTGEGLPELAARLQVLAVAQGVTVAAAESCTGGLVGHGITANAGSSTFFVGGVVSYADAVKVKVLDVPAEAIERHGAVSAQVAVARAPGVRTHLGADYGVAVTGVAGPNGGTDAKPVGLTYVAVAGPQGDEVRRHAWDGDRAANKDASARAALRLLIDVIEASTRVVTEPQP